MATITLSGFTTPFVPNSGIAAFDTDNVPEQLTDNTVGGTAADTVLTSADPSDFSRPSAVRTAPSPVRLLAEVQTDTQLQATLNAPLLLDPGTETHLTKRHWLFGSPLTVASTANTGTLFQAIARLLNRLSKIGRGVN